METAGKGWEREGSSVPGGHLFTIISERSERAIDHSEVNQGMRVDRLHGVLSAQARVLTVRLSLTVFMDIIRGNNSQIPSYQLSYESY